MEINFKDEIYPKQLRKINNPPKRLEILGNQELLNQKGIAIIGSRTCTEYGKNMAIKFAKQLSKYGLTIISGMATGVDSYAHIGALEVKGKTIAVLPCGLNKIYPEENKELYQKILTSGGLVVSEYRENTEANSKRFLERNRIVSGLAIGTLVIEGAFRSGTSVTAKITKENNKPIFCIPSSLENSKGFTPNKLIQEGNILVMSAEDIVDNFPQYKFTKQKSRKRIYKGIIENNKNEKREKQNLDKKEIKNSNKNVNIEYLDIYELITEEPQHINDIIRKSKIDINEVNYKLMMLELEGNIIAMPGKFFKKG